MVTMGENVFKGLLAVLLFLGYGHKSLGTELSEESKEDIEWSSIIILPFQLRCSFRHFCLGFSNYSLD